MNIYSIKNEKLNFFNRPIYCESDNEALSYIQNVLMSDADRALSSLKGDLSLYLLGSIDFVTGIIAPSVNIHDVDYVEGETLPIKICSLEDIFNSIPEERLKPAVTVENIKYLDELIKKLGTELEALKTHKHDKKGGTII